MGGFVVGLGVVLRDALEWSGEMAWGNDAVLVSRGVVGVV